MAQDGTTDFEALARQYWGAWGEAMRQAGAPAPAAGAAPVQPGVQAWQDALDWWTRLAHGNRADVDTAVGRFNTQAHDWYAQMQQVAARFAGQQASAGDIAGAWKQALGAAGDNPFPEMLRSLRGQGLQGLDQWVQDASPMLQAWQNEASSMLGMPAFGFAREHQERWQGLAQAQLDYQQRNAAYNALMGKAGQRAFELFERKLAGRAGADQPKLKSARALFDLWIDAAEEAYADIALSPEFRQAYGALVNAQMRLRAGVQGEVERAGATMGMPTRTEIDAAHRKIAELERALRRLRDAAGAGATAAADVESRRSARPSARPAPVKKAGGSPASKRRPAARKATTPAAAKRTARPAAQRASARKSTTKPTTTTVGTPAKKTGKPAMRKTAKPAPRRASTAKPAMKERARPAGKAALKKTSRSTGKAGPKPGPKSRAGKR